MAGSTNRDTGRAADESRDRRTGGDGPQAPQAMMVKIAASKVPPPKNQAPKVPAVDQAYRVLEAMARARGEALSLTEICQATGLHKSRVHSLLDTLASVGLVTKNQRTKVHALGPGLIALGRAAAEGLDHGRTARPHLDDLAGATKATVFMGLISGQRFVIVARGGVRAEARRNIGFDVPLGRSLRLDHGAHGPVLAAHLPDQAHLDWPRATADPSGWREKVARAAADGFMIDNGIFQPGVTALSAPVFDYSRTLVGAVVALDSDPEGALRDRGRVVAACAGAISMDLGADPETLPPGLRTTVGY